MGIADDEEAHGFAPSIEARGVGALSGLTVIEFAGLGPGPFCAMMLADHGADVIRIDRIGATTGEMASDVLNRSRRAVGIDLKSHAGVALARRLCARADALIEGFRPGVMERLGLGPDLLTGDNPALVYGRMTGWGQDGPLAQTAGHDINYIALSGALHAVGSSDGPPVPPLNIVGDFGGGGMMLAFGILAGIIAARASGRGQVIDCAMTDGSAMLMAMAYSMKASGQWQDRRGTNMLDSGAHFYTSYRTADDKWVAVGSVEPQFYRELLERMGLTGDPRLQDQMDDASWPLLKTILAERFGTRTRDQWCAAFEGSDACFSPVLSMGEAPEHGHNVARGTFVTCDGVVQPAPAPRMGGTPPRPPERLARDAATTGSVLARLGLDAADIDRLVAQGIVA